MSDMQRTVDDVIEALKNAKQANRSCSLLIGAGCSVTPFSSDGNSRRANIPSADEFVSIIQREWPKEHARAKEKSYAQCMAQLSPHERQELIKRYVDDAKINWGHIAIAQLMKFDYIGRILTTNFDNLVARACAMVGQFPAIYDFAASQADRLDNVPEKAVFHLHGQHTGFVLMNTEDECERHSKVLGPVFDDSARRRMWIVVGYSGRNDPVFDHLAKFRSFNFRLYWVGYRDEDPGVHVRENLLLPQKYAFHVPGHDADDFFVLLAQGLGCFPPLFVADPLEYVNFSLEKLAPYSVPGQSGRSGIDICGTTRELIRLARQAMTQALTELTDRQSTMDTKEDSPAGASLAMSMTPEQANALLVAGKYDELIALDPGGNASLPKDLSQPLALAYLRKADLTGNQALAASGADAYALFEKACRLCRRAADLDSNQADAFVSWGHALSEQARMKSGTDADLLFSEACEKYAQAEKLAPNSHNLARNWALTLVTQAYAKAGEDVDGLFKLGHEKFAQAILVVPEDYRALTNWSAMLITWSKMKCGSEAERMFAEAKAIAEKAESIMPGIAAYNLACWHALRGDEDETRRWLTVSRDKEKLPPPKVIANDDDLKIFRDRSWFKQFVQTD